MPLPLLATGPTTPDIVVIADRVPAPALLTGVSTTTVDLPRIEAEQLPQVTDYLRLTPGIAVSTSGGLGQFTEVRIRGAEANQTLVFIDGVPSNDPASSSEFLFNTLPADGIQRIEILRGPQSALWGSEAIGGVINITTPAPERGQHLTARAEGGSLGTYRAATTASYGTDVGGISTSANYVATDGIPIAQGGHIRNGFDNLTLSAKGVLHPSSAGELGASVRYTDATSRYDDASNGIPVDANFATTNRALAVRGYGDAHLIPSVLDAHIEASYLDTDNVNRLDRAFQNATAATRFRLVGQTTLALTTGALTHQLTGAAEYEAQSYRANDTVFGGLTNGRARRDQTSGIGEYRVQYLDRAAASIAVRRDLNSGFADATTVRTAGSLQLPRHFDLHASYGEGVQDPTFTQQFGFFPGLFIGNPALKPERSRGYDGGLGWHIATASFDVTYFHTDLTSKFSDIFTNAGLGSTVNAPGRSLRQGVEVSAQAHLLAWLSLTANYTWLDATRPALADGTRLREVRRPEHSGSVALTAHHGPAEVAFTTAYVGDHGDTFFGPPDFAGTPETLHAYWLGSLAGSYALGHGVELTARVENAFNQHYQDVFGYQTPGVTAYGGVRVRLR